MIRGRYVVDTWSIRRGYVEAGLLGILTITAKVVDGCLSSQWQESVYPPNG